MYVCSTEEIERNSVGVPAIVSSSEQNIILETTLPLSKICTLNICVVKLIKITAAFLNKV